MIIRRACVLGQNLMKLRMPGLSEAKLFGAECRRIRRQFSKFDTNQPVNLEAELAKVKQEAKSLLEKEKQDIEQGKLTKDQIVKMLVEITDMESFKSKVVERKKPIVVFCMAKWCATSKSILPFMLDKYSQNHKEWDLAILDIEIDPKLTTMLNINKVPTVFLVVNGEIIDGFKGLVSETEMNNFVETANRANQLVSGQELSQQLFNELMQKFGEKKWDEVIQDSEKLKKQATKKDSIRLVSLIQIVAMVETQKRENQIRAKQLYLDLEKTPLPKDSDPQILNFIDQIETSIKNFIVQFDEYEKTQNENIEKTFQENKDNPEALFNTATSAVEKGGHELALRCLYAILQKDKNWGDKKAHKLYVEILKNPKADKTTVFEYRKKLASLIA